MQFPTKKIMAICVGFFLGTCVVSAQQKPTSNGERMALSARLYAYSLAESDPIAAINAASIRKSAMLLEGQIGIPDSALGVGKPAISWVEMLSTASKLASGRVDLAALIEDVRAANSKGLITGAIISHAEIKPGGKRTYFDMRFEGGAYAEVYLEGRDQTDIDMFVYNENGDLICAQTDPSPISLCSWTPATTNNFRIVVENKSTLGTHYSLITN